MLCSDAEARKRAFSRPPTGGWASQQSPSSVQVPGQVPESGTDFSPTAESRVSPAVPAA